jgi:aryl-alcohol dehydrogenase-like predicted oxidoreductase
VRTSHPTPPAQRSAPAPTGGRLYRPFGVTGRTFFRLGLGTASLAGVNMVGAPVYHPPSRPEVDTLLTTAIESLGAEASAVMIDTAAQYGESERWIGDYLAAHPAARLRVYLATKWGLVFDPGDFARHDYSVPNLERSAAASSRHLGSIDLLYLHTNPSVPPPLLGHLLRGPAADVMREMKATGRFGIRHLGVSVSSPANLELLLGDPALLQGFDALQVTARLLPEHPRLARSLGQLPIGVVLNSPFRKADPATRHAESERRAIYHRILDTHDDAVILTGTRDPGHLSENRGHVMSWASVPLEISYATDAPTSVARERVSAELRGFFRRFVHSGPDASPDPASMGPAAPALATPDQVTDRVVALLVGSRKARLGPAPTERQRRVLRERVGPRVAAGRAIEVILTWGPHKFAAPAEADVPDLGEAAAIERLYDLHRLVQSVYPPGLRYAVFVEDLEGHFIERPPPEAFAPYGDGLEALVRVLGVADTIRVVRTSELVTRRGERRRAQALLDANYERLQAYWLESERRGIPGSDHYESSRALASLGFTGIITEETRRFYLGRLDRLLGDRRTREEKVDMVIRLLACVLMHRQLDLFRGGDGLEPVKLSFLGIAGGPPRLMDGRLDIRTVLADVSRRSLAPWSAKGCLRFRTGRVLPALIPWPEALRSGTPLVPGRVAFMRGSHVAVVRADFLEATQTAP